MRSKALGPFVKPKDKKPLSENEVASSTKKATSLGDKMNARVMDSSRAASVSRHIVFLPGVSLCLSLFRRLTQIQANLGHDPKIRVRLGGDGKYTGRHALFRNSVLARLEIVLADMRKQDFLVLGLTVDKLNQEAIHFMTVIDSAFHLAEQNVTRRDRNPLFWNLRDAFIQKDIRGLQNEVKYSFQSFLARDRFSKKLAQLQQHMLDFRFPQDWFPGTREMQRTIHLHVGPTNSGKTYTALQAMEKSRNGVYAGPLRLLAAEVYQRLVAKGHSCALLTGEEVRQPQDSDQYLTSCTVEMVPMNNEYDVAVIDEIQMINDPVRGSAWAMALLGIRAKELHLCGEERTVKLIEAICASIGDKCVVHHYKRLSPLEAMDTALDNDFSKLEKGDAIVAFNRLALHALKRNIEKQTGRRCAIVYGSLPPEVRMQQAALFNDPNNDYDYIVASDAIGMGLNLEIRRVILESVTKYDGSQSRLLNFPEIKQIGGRAGRYRSATNPNGEGDDAANEPKVGMVTSMEYADLHRIRRAFRSDVEDINVAYIEPPPGIIERFAAYYPSGTPLSFIMQRVRAVAILNPPYHISIPDSALEIADIVQDFKMSIADKLTFCRLPIRLRNHGSTDVLKALAAAVADNLPGDFLSIKAINIEDLDLDMSDTKRHGATYLAKLETLHDAINQYVWLSYRYAGIFRDQALAFHVRTLVEDRLVDLLERLNFTEKDLERHRQRGRMQAQTRELNRSVLDESLTEDESTSSNELPEVTTESREAVGV